MCAARWTGVEALVRWQHPRDGLLTPGAFIPLAEESDLIVSLGEWVLAQACAVVAQPDFSQRRLRMSVNLGAQAVSRGWLCAQPAEPCCAPRGQTPRCSRWRSPKSLVIDEL